MPNCFQLCENGVAVPLVRIDREICQLLGVEEHPTRWCDIRDGDWFNTLGFGMACGKTYEQLRELYPEAVKVIDYLESKYTINAYYEPK